MSDNTASEWRHIIDRMGEMSEIENYDDHGNLLIHPKQTISRLVRENADLKRKLDKVRAKCKKWDKSCADEVLEILNE